MLSSPPPLHTIYNLFIHHGQFRNFLKETNKRTKDFTLRRFQQVFDDMHYQHVHWRKRLPESSLVAASNEQQRVAIKRSHNLPAPCNEIWNVVAGKECATFRCWQIMNITHAQNGSCQSSSHRAGHWFLTSLTTCEIFFCRRPNIICVLKIRGEKKTH